MIRVEDKIEMSFVDLRSIVPCAPCVNGHCWLWRGVVACDRSEGK